MITYPYTDFHEMNLDWILEKVKELLEQVSVLTSDFETLKQYVVETLSSENIDAVVLAELEKLIEDGTFDEILREAIENLNKKLLVQSHTVAPVCLGTFLQMAHTPQGACKRENFYYQCIPDENTSNTGTIRIFNFETEKEETSIENIVMGHGNSLVWDDTEKAWFIAPNFTYASGSAQYLIDIYKYTEDFSSYVIETPPVRLESLAYDYTTGKMYGKSHSTKELYVRDDGTWVKVCVLAIDDIEMLPNVTAGLRDIRFNQDLAVHNNMWFMNTQGYIAYGDVETGALYGAFVTESNDSAGRWFLGENEGMNFDRTGHLMVTYITNLRGNLKNCLICEIPVGLTNPYVPTRPTIQSQNNYLQLNTDTQESFVLSPLEAQSINQLMATNVDHVGVNITGTVVEPETVYITKNTKLNIQGALIVPSIRVVGSVTLTILCNTNGSIRLTGTDANGRAIVIEQDGQVDFAGVTALSVTFDTPATATGRPQFVYPLNACALIRSGAAVPLYNGNQVYIGSNSVHLEPASIYLNDNKLN